MDFARPEKSASGAPKLRTASASADRCASPGVRGTHCSSARAPVAASAARASSASSTSRNAVTSCSAASAAASPSDVSSPSTATRVEAAPASSERRGPKSCTASPSRTADAQRAPGPLAPCAKASSQLAPRASQRVGVYVRIPSSGRKSCTLSPGVQATSRSSAPSSSMSAKRGEGRCTRVTLALRNTSGPRSRPSSTFGDATGAERQPSSGSPALMRSNSRACANSPRAWMRFTEAPKRSRSAAMRSSCVAAPAL